MVKPCCLFAACSEGEGVLCRHTRLQHHYYRRTMHGRVDWSSLESYTSDTVWEMHIQLVGRADLAAHLAQAKGYSVASLSDSVALPLILYT